MPWVSKDELLKHIIKNKLGKNMTLTGFNPMQLQEEVDWYEKRLVVYSDDECFGLSNDYDEYEYSLPN